MDVRLRQLLLLLLLMHNGFLFVICCGCDGINKRKMDTQLSLAAAGAAARRVQRAAFGEFPTTSSSSFEFEFELARSFLILCG